MVGIVLVSHSSELATAVKALAGQQTQGRAAIAAVGGTGDPEQPFGTDAMAILEAIQSVYGEDGVLVLMDLGSALLSAEMALEFLDPEQAHNVRLSAGPFVEGAMAAAVQASIGMDLTAVANEATDAMTPKRQSLGVAVASGDVGEQAPEAREEAPGAGAGGEVSARVTLVNHAGLHFGPAVLLVQEAAAHEAEIAVRNLTTGSGPADARRFNQVLSLGAEQGHDIELVARGPNAAAALAALIALAKAGFGESGEASPSTLLRTSPSTPLGTDASTAPAPTAGIESRGRAVLQGLPASTGVAVGTAFLLSASISPTVRHVRRVTVADPAAEWERYEQAEAAAQAELQGLAERMARELGSVQARIFQAHALTLADPDLQAEIQTQILEHGLNAEAALVDATEAAAQRFRDMEGARFQERAADLLDVQARVLRLLAGAAKGVAEAVSIELPSEAIIVADDLAPSQTATLDRSKVIGLCTAGGGPTAHSAILARSMGIPAVVGLGDVLLAQVLSGEKLAMDGGAGIVVVRPDQDTQTAYRRHRQDWLEQRRLARVGAQSEAHTRDGKRVEVVANLAVAVEAAPAREAGAEGVGLLRTEFLFQDRLEPPAEDEQVAIYGQVAETMSPYPVIVRTLDIGGDKPAPYLNLPSETNPFLGWRALRISLEMPDFFKTQLKAVLRAAAAVLCMSCFLWCQRFQRSSGRKRCWRRQARS